LSDFDKTWYHDAQ